MKIRACDVCQAYPLCIIRYKLNLVNNEHSFIRYDTQSSDEYIAQLCSQFKRKEGGLK
jgi:hypothetical protein